MELQQCGFPPTSSALRDMFAPTPARGAAARQGARGPQPEREGERVLASITGLRRKDHGPRRRAAGPRLDEGGMVPVLATDLIRRC
ncbi:hypothetical protein NDU88_004665 [Pleurodeles waltl]|uniref:Uncharacterized protein n=1 Tax=Pleurodeles waltl TaxID=8319 RepID=A0AAV7TA99_PLEWA|nr:hypothetical protein NDU88_004665 [Pleurodeles waltl]